MLALLVHVSAKLLFEKLYNNILISIPNQYRSSLIFFQHFYSGGFIYQENKPLKFEMKTNRVKSRMEEKIPGTEWVGWTSTPPTLPIILLIENNIFYDWAHFLPIQ